MSGVRASVGAGGLQLRGALEPSRVSLVCHLTIRANGAARNTIIRVDNSGEKQL